MALFTRLSTPTTQRTASHIPQNLVGKMKFLYTFGSIPIRIPLCSLWSLYFSPFFLVSIVAMEGLNKSCYFWVRSSWRIYDNNIDKEWGKNVLATILSTKEQTNTSLFVWSDLLEQKFRPCSYWTAFFPFCPLLPIGNFRRPELELL